MKIASYFLLGVFLIMSSCRPKEGKTKKANSEVSTSNLIQSHAPAAMNMDDFLLYLDLMAIEGRSDRLGILKKLWLETSYGLSKKGSTSSIQGTCLLVNLEEGFEGEIPDGTIRSPRKRALVSNEQRTNDQCQKMMWPLIKGIYSEDLIFSFLPGRQFNL